MGTNSILPFGAAATNEQNDATYAASGVRVSGVVPGVADPLLANKVWHQTSLIAAGVAQYIADRQAANITDALTPAQIAAYLASASAGRLTGVRTFTASTTYAPTAGTKYIRVRVLGGGGAGGGSTVTNGSQLSFGTGGGSGAYGEGFITSGFDGVAITVGAAGAQALGVAGGAGGTSSFGSLVVAQGGNGGATYGPTVAPLTAGQNNTAIATGGYLQVPGRSGVGGFMTTLNFGYAGRGADSIWGAAGGDQNGSGDGTSAGGYGAGGSGGLSPASSVVRFGGNGAPGLVLIEEYA